MLLETANSRRNAVNYFFRRIESRCKSITASVTPARSNKVKPIRVVSQDTISLPACDPKEKFGDTVGKVADYSGHPALRSPPCGPAFGC